MAYSTRLPIQSHRFEPAKLQAAGKAQPKQWGDFLNKKQFRDHLFAKVTIYGKKDSITAFHVSVQQHVGYTPPVVPGERIGCQERMALPSFPNVFAGPEAGTARTLNAARLGALQGAAAPAQFR